MDEVFQNLSKFGVPPGFRNRNGLVVLLWQIIQSTLYGLSPQPLYGWRRWLLRLFGARIGKKVLLRPTSRITYPWKLEIGDFSWIGDNVELYSLDKITIGKHTVVSQRTYLCTGSHRVDDVAFSYVTAPIIIEDQVWIATDVFIAPGVTIREGAVVGARSSVFSDVARGMVAIGSPAESKRKRLNK